VLPFVWTALNSVKLPKDANARTPRFIFQPTLDNYTDLWLDISLERFAPYGFGLLALVGLAVGVALFSKRFPISQGVTYLIIASVILAALFSLPQFVNFAEFYDYSLNSIIVTIGTLTVSLTIGALAGYGLARYRGFLSVVILTAALAFRALPGLAFVLPYYYLGQLSGFYDTHILLILSLVAVNQPFTIWMLRSFFMEIPREIEEAAMIDGAGRLQAFTAVIIPIMWPGIITTGLFTLLLAYNDFLFARILMQTNLTLPVGISQFTGGEDPGHITLAAAASVSITLPILLIIIFFQKHLVSGLASGAVKG
jgi:multiple sugar transport system permease protein